MAHISPKTIAAKQATFSLVIVQFIERTSKNVSLANPLAELPGKLQRAIETLTGNMMDESRIAFGIRMVNFARYRRVRSDIESYDIRPGETSVATPDIVLSRMCLVLGLERARSLCLGTEGTDTMSHEDAWLCGEVQAYVKSQKEEDYRLLEQMGGSPTPEDMLTALRSVQYANLTDEEKLYYEYAKIDCKYLPEQITHVETEESHWTSSIAFSESNRCNMGTRSAVWQFAEEVAKTRTGVVQMTFVQGSLNGTLQAMSRVAVMNDVWQHEQILRNYTIRELVEYLRQLTTEERNDLKNSFFAKKLLADLKNKHYQNFVRRTAMLQSSNKNFSTVRKVILFRHNCAKALIRVLYRSS